MSPIPRLHKETSLFNSTKTFSSTFKVLADSITSMVKGEETYTDPVTGETKTNTFGTVLKQTANNVLIKATKNASTDAAGGQALIESLINVAPEGIKIAANHIDVEGAAIFKSGGKLAKVVKSSQTQWYSSTSASERKGGSWSTNQPAVTAGRFIWQRTYYQYTDGTSAYDPNEAGVCVTALTDISATIKAVDVEYAQGTSPTTAPESGWSTTAPTIAAGKYLWTRTKTTFANNQSSYTKTTCISGDNGKLVTAAKEQYYLSSSSTAQTGGSWVDTCPTWATGKYIWTRTHMTYSDGTTGASTPTLATAINDANSKAYSTVTGVDVEYADSTSSTKAPTGGWSTTAPSWQAGHYIWQRTKTMTPVGTSYSTPTCISGRDGVDGSAAYNYTINSNPAALVRAADGTLTPTSITFSATRAQGSGSPAAYSGRFAISEYDGSTWADKYTSSSNQSSKSYSPTATAKMVRCNLYLAGGLTTMVDTQTVPIASNGEDGADGAKGADGKDAYTVMLTNESHTFAASTSAAVASSALSRVIAYKGTTQVAATIGSITGAPSGMSTSVSNNNTTSASFTVSVTTSLTPRQGVLSVPVTVDGKAFALAFSWSLALTGANGANGANGTNGTDGKDGRGISAIVEQYYLSTSDTTQSGGSWSTEPPAYVKNRYYWTRSRITWSDSQVTYTDPVLANDVTSIAQIANAAVKTAVQLWFTKANTTAPDKPKSKVTSTSTAPNDWRVVVPTFNASYPNYFYCWQYTQMDGTCAWSDVVYDAQATESLGTARGAQARSQLIFKNFPAGTLSVSGTTTWVTETGQVNNAWTTKFLEHNTDRPVIFCATQSQTVAQMAAGSTCSCTTPVKDDTLTKIDGGHITTGEIDASVVTVKNIDASKITVGELDAARIKANSLAIGKFTTEVQNKLALVGEATYRGVCSTSAKTADKVVSCTGFELKTGAAIVVYMSTAQTCYNSSLTLNVNGTGAKTIYVGDKATSSANELLWAAGASVTFVYDGTYWYVADSPGTWNGGTCTALAAEDTKEASCPKIVIFNGVSVKLQMRSMNTSNYALLDVQSLGSFPIYFGNTSSRPTYNNGYTWQIDSIVEFVFDGYCWRTGSRTYIDGGSILTGTINTNRLDATSIQTNIVKTCELSADKITSGTISANRISGGTLTGLRFISESADKKVEIDKGQIIFNYIKNGTTYSSAKIFSYGGLNGISSIGISNRDTETQDGGWLRMTDDTIDIVSRSGQKIIEMEFHTYIPSFKIRLSDDGKKDRFMSFLMDMDHVILMRDHGSDVKQVNLLK